jgi:hypothetical protein
MTGKRKLRTKAAKTGRRSRDKGGRYEREIAEALRPLFPRAVRGVGQARASGEIPDVKGTPFWTECKHRQALNVTEALDQAATELTVYRSNGGTTRYLCPLLVARLDTKAAFTQRKDIAVLLLEDFLSLLRWAHDDALIAPEDRVVFVGPLGTDVEKRTTTGGRFCAHAPPAAPEMSEIEEQIVAEVQQSAAGSERSIDEIVAALRKSGWDADEAARILLEKEGGQ